jgi:hypothetical protein
LAEFPPSANMGNQLDLDLEDVKQYVPPDHPTPSQQQPECPVGPVHTLPRRIEIKWFIAIYLALFTAGKFAPRSIASTRRVNSHVLHAGWSDASTGPLLLRIQNHYSVSYTVVSVIFICNFSGFLLAALTNVWFSDRFGMGKTTLLGALVHVGVHKSR